MLGDSRHSPGVPFAFTNAVAATAHGDELFRLLVENVRDYAIFMLDVSGNVITWNRGAERLKGWAAHEIVGRSFAHFYLPEERESGKPARELRIAAAEGSYREEGIRVRKDGSLFRADVLITAVRDDRGELRGFAKVTRDVTERHEADERFRLLVESVRDYAIFMLDPDGTVVSWNVGAERLKGYSSGEIVGRHFSLFYTEEDRADHKPDRALAIARGEGRYQEEGTRVRKDGTTFRANVLITPLHSADGTLRGFAKVTRDVTEARDAEQRLRNAFEELEQASRIKDEFLSTISHELRTPMTAILGWASLLTTSIDDQETTKAGVSAIHDSAQLQAKLIDDLLDVAYSLTGKLTIEPQRVDLAELVRRTAEAARPLAATRRLRLDVDVPAAGAAVAGDRGRLQQVLWNLLSNALKFTPPGGSVRVEVTTDAQAATLRVSDTGRGMDEESLRNLFRRFWQAESTTTRSAGGLGIGLALTRHIVELHGGTIAAESAGLNEGATFRVALPLAPEQPETARDAPPRNALRGALVLLLEDDPASRLVLARMLEEYGAEVIPVGSANEGLRVLEERTPNVIVSDIAMPEVDGFAFIQQLRRHARASGVPAVAVTAVYLRAEERERLLEAGFNAYLRKPIVPAELTATLLRAAKITE